MSYRIAIPFYHTPSRYLDRYPEAWATAHDSNNAIYVISTIGGIGAYTGRNGAGYHCRRAAMFFDTSGISGKTIVSARIVGKSVACYEIDSGHAKLYVIEGVFSTPVVASDYGLIRDAIVSGGSLEYANIGLSINSPSILELNSTGFGWIVQGGTTKFSLRVHGDLQNLTPVNIGWNAIAFEYDSGTQGLAPVSQNATNVSRMGVTMNALYRGVDQPSLDIEYNGDLIEYPYLCFVWGRGSAYDQLTDPRRNVAVGDSFSEALTGLRPRTLHRYKARVYTAAATYKQGSAKSFTTDPLCGNPIIDQIIHQHCERMTK